MGSGDAILCADHPILGQAVIVLHLDYPNCYESQDAFSSGHVECTSLPHRSDVVKILGTLDSRPILLNIRIPTLSFRTFQKLWPYPFKHWNSGPILSKIGIPTLSFQTLVFHHYPPSNVGFPALYFQTLEFQPFPFKHWYATTILFQTLVLWPYPFKHWNSGPILSNIRIPALSFLTLEFQPYPF